MFALFALAAASLHGQVYWSTTVPDCTGVEGPLQFTNPATGSGTVYACYISGTFVWLAAGGPWGTAIRVAAPASGAVGVDYTFYDESGNNLSLDTNFGSGTSTTSGNEVDFALSANQPAEVDLLGAAGGGPGYTNLLDGSVYATFYCPDATTCGDVVPQLLYSALPTYPWSLSVPIAWDTAVWTQWSAEAIDDGGAHVVGFVVYNEGTTAATYTIRVYNNAGTLVGTGTTPSIPGFQPLAGGYYGEAGTYSALLRQVVPTLPSGVFKILIDGGSAYSAIEVLQITGASATTLQVAYDTSPSAGAAVTSAQARRAKEINTRAAAAAKRVFSPVPTR